MAKKSRKVRKGNKPNYQQGWATRRRNAALTAAKDEVRGFANRGAAALQADHVKNLMDQAKADGERSLLDPQTGNGQTHGAPGHGEIVGGADAKLTEEVIKLARKKGGFDAVKNALTSALATAKYEGSTETDKLATKRLIQVQQIQADRVVCGFIAEVEHSQKLHHGLPPGMTWMLNSFTVIKIIDALNAAGYYADGRRGSVDKAVGS